MALPDSPITEEVSGGSAGQLSSFGLVGRCRGDGLRGVVTGGVIVCFGIRRDLVDVMVSDSFIIIYCNLNGWKWSRGLLRLTLFSVLLKLVRAIFFLDVSQENLSRSKSIGQGIHLYG